MERARAGFYAFFRAVAVSTGILVAACVMATTDRAQAETAADDPVLEPIGAEGPAIRTATQPIVLTILPERRRISGTFNRAARGLSHGRGLSSRFNAMGRRGITSARFNRASRGLSQRGSLAGRFTAASRHGATSARPHVHRLATSLRRWNQPRPQLNYNMRGPIGRSAAITAQSRRYLLHRSVERAAGPTARPGGIRYVRPFSRARALDGRGILSSRFLLTTPLRTRFDQAVRGP